MDWKIKYIKYKTKYLELKQIIKDKNKYIGGEIHSDINSNYFNALESLYPKCIKNPAESNDKTHIYGEMEYTGVKALYDEINQINPEIKYFLDIGSGRGKLVCWFAGLEHIVKSIGIEIVEQRCRDAEKLRIDLEENFSSQTDKIELLCGDVSTYNLTELTSGKPDTLVWISNLCFGDELSLKVFTQIINQLVPGTIITCSKKPIEKNSTTQLNKLKFISTIKIQMSWWNKLSEVHIFQII